MDGATIKRKVQRLFGDSSELVFSEADIIDWINEAQNQIARETGCLTGSVTPAASAFPYAYPNDFIKVKRLVYGTRPLTECPIEDLDAKMFDLSTQDTPWHYYFVNNTIALYPDPPSTDSTVVTIQYQKMPTVLTGIGDTITLPLHMHDDIVRFCTMRAHERNENYRAMEIKASEFNQMSFQRNDDYDDPTEAYSVKRDDPYSVWYPYP